MFQVFPTKAKWTPPAGFGVVSGVGTGSGVPMLTKALSSDTSRKAVRIPVRTCGLRRGWQERRHGDSV